MPAGLTRFFGLFTSLWATLTGKTDTGRRYASGSHSVDIAAPASAVAMLQSIIYDTYRASPDGALSVANELLAARFPGRTLTHVSLQRGKVSAAEARYLVAGLERELPSRRRVVLARFSTLR